uniref:glutamate racemase n=1 Tax=Agathobacter sp. TaxID=2021311 RepID=UPI004055D630
MLEKQKKPIAVFDSGVGGISVLRELVKIMPNENYIYFGDSKNAPYGMKTKEEVRKFTLDCAKMLFEGKAGCQDLNAGGKVMAANLQSPFPGGAKGLVVACNTATSAAVRELRHIYPDVPIVGIEPAVKPAVAHKPGGQVLVMATPMTIREEKFRTLMGRYSKQAKIIPLPCPGLMDFVERGDLHSTDFRKYLEELLYEYRVNKVDAAVLGCTHYPFAKGLIQEILGQEVMVVDGGEGTAREMKRRLTEADLINPSMEKGEILFENSLEDNAEKIALCRRLLEMQ